MIHKTRNTHSQYSEIHPQYTTGGKYSTIQGGSSPWGSNQAKGHSSKPDCPRASRGSTAQRKRRYISMGSVADFDI